jgi:hypothetical protein
MLEMSKSYLEEKIGVLLIVKCGGRYLTIDSSFLFN